MTLEVEVESAARRWRLAGDSLEADDWASRTEWRAVAPANPVEDAATRKLSEKLSGLDSESDEALLLSAIEYAMTRTRRAIRERLYGLNVDGGPHGAGLRELLRLLEAEAPVAQLELGRSRQKLGLMSRLLARPDSRRLLVTAGTIRLLGGSRPFSMPRDALTSIRLSGARGEWFLNFMAHDDAKSIRLVDFAGDAAAVLVELAKSGLTITDARTAT